jgi:undecaprenyl-diphosphatase
MTYLQAIVIALIQGVTELFPVSSLGHSVLVPAWLGGSWQTLVTQYSQENSEASFYLAYLVALHCATALALLWFFRADWVRIIGGFFRSLLRSVRKRRLLAEDSDERLAWLIVIATVPVGLTGVTLEHLFRTLLAKPLAAGIFLFLNGLILLWGERVRRRATPAAVPAGAAAAADDPAKPPVAAAARASTWDQPRHTSGARSVEEITAARASDARIAGLGLWSAFTIGLFQVAALLPGISRSGITMVGGLWRGLDHEDAARFAFLLATPVIFAAGVLKLPSLTGSTAADIRGQILVGSIVTGVTAYLSVRFLVRYFETRTLTPFAIYCLIFGGASILRFGLG